MSKFAAALLLVLLAVSGRAAERVDWRAAATAAIGQTADTVTTVRSLRRGCVEANIWAYSSQPRIGRIVAVKAATVGLSLLLLRVAPARVGRVVAWTIGLTGASAAVWNLAVC